MEKFFLNSKTIQGVIMLFIAFSKLFFDIDITADDIEPIITGVVGLVGAILALYGRFQAKEPLKLTPTDPVLYGGAFDGVKETDWILGDIATVEDLPNLVKGTYHEYNQNNIGPNSCTLATATTNWTFTSGIIRSYENLQEAYRRACKAPKPLDPKVGWDLHLAIDLIRNMGKELYGFDTNSMAFLIKNELKAVQKKGYMVSTGFRGNAAYNKDKNDDGIVSGLHLKPTYGHAPSIMPTIIWDGMAAAIQDNYKGVVKYNRYKVESFEQMINNKLWFTRGFVYYIPQGTGPVKTSYEKMKARAIQLQQEGKTKKQIENILLIEKTLGKFK